jgi:hypothetical protein
MYRRLREQALRRERRRRQKIQRLLAEHASTLARPGAGGGMKPPGPALATRPAPERQPADDRQ